MTQLMGANQDKLNCDVFSWSYAAFMSYRSNRNSSDLLIMS